MKSIIKLVFLIIFSAFLSWLFISLVTAGIFWCFGWMADWSLKIATGVWLVFILFRFNFKFNWGLNEKSSEI